MTLKELLDKLLAARSPGDMRAVLDQLGDHSDIDLDKPFGELGLFWHAFGGNESNISSIGLGSKAGKSLTERITNAQDALLEAEARRSTGALPSSPWDAAEAWFGRPRSERDGGAFKWKYGKIDQRIEVVLLDSGVEAAPTVDVLDDGVGLRAEDFPRTILSLQAGNKIKNRHLIGAFGQGGAAALAFADYTIIVSRSRADPSSVGFTVVRVLSLSETYKEDCYGFLAMTGDDGTLTVPSVPFGAKETLALYAAEQKSRTKKAPELASGTLVRHVGYKLSGLEKGLSPSPGNLWHFLHVSMFDPILPFRVNDLRPGGKDRVITGSRNRLLKHVDAKGIEAAAGEESDDDEGDEGSASRTELKAYHPMEFVKPHGSTNASIGIEYWVIANYQTKKNSPTRTLRARSNELFTQRGYPIIGTLNGQNQGKLPARVVSELGLQMVSNHIVVHIDASRADSKTRRELFSTNREGFKDGPVLDSIVDVLKDMLEEDEQLEQIEKEFTDKLLAKEAQETKSEVKKAVQRLLQDTGLDLTAEGTNQVAGQGDEGRTRKKNRRAQNRAPPLKTLPYPQVTRFQMVWPNDSIEVPLDDLLSVFVETDADSQFDREGKIAIRAEPPHFQEVSKAPLTGGRMRWRLKVSQAAKVGDAGKVVVTLTKPDGTQLTDSADFALIKPVTEKAKTAKGRVPPFDIIGINPDDDAEQWSNTWPDLDELDDQTKVSYKLIPASGKLTVFYSEIYAPFKEQIESFKEKNQAEMAQLFTQNYEIWIGYHAILQHQAVTDFKPRGDELKTAELAAEAERNRVAQVEVAQARRVAELQQRLVKNEASDDGGGRTRRKRDSDAPKSAVVEAEQRPPVVDDRCDKVTEQGRCSAARAAGSKFCVEHQ